MTALFLESEATNDNDLILLIGLVQLIVGFVQLLGAFIRTVYALVKKKPLTNLIYYWLAVCVYFIVMYVLCEFNSGIVVGWVGAAWIIAIWYWAKIVFNNKSYN